MYEGMLSSVWEPNGSHLADSHSMQSFSCPILLIPKPSVIDIDGRVSRRVYGGLNPHATTMRYKRILKSNAYNQS